MAVGDLEGKIGDLNGQLRLLTPILNGVGEKVSGVAEKVAAIEQNLKSVWAEIRQIKKVQEGSSSKWWQFVLVLISALVGAGVSYAASRVTKG